MKRPILIIISVITIFILLGTAVTYLFGIGAPSLVSSNLGYGGGGAPMQAFRRHKLPCQRLIFLQQKRQPELQPVT